MNKYKKNVKLNCLLVALPSNCTIKSPDFNEIKTEAKKNRGK